MEKEDRETIRHISDTIDEILSVLKKPGSKFIRALDIVGTIVSVLAILGIIEIIRNWILGG